MKSTDILLVLLFAFFCVSNGCPFESIKYQKACYIFQSNATTFISAEIACNEMGGNLTSIHDAFENNFLSNQSQQFSDDDFWVGLSRLISGNWTWMDNTTIDYTDWAPKEPANLDCAAVLKKDSSWLASDCSKAKPYVCKIRDNKYCYSGYTYYEPTDSCYGYTRTFPYEGNWTLSEQYCQSEGGHLVSLHSAAEHAFVWNLLPYNPWTGLTRKDNTSEFKWSDGSPLDYFPWADHQPLSFENCAYYSSDGKFYSWQCRGSGLAMCKFPNHPLPTSNILENV
uniref:C-type lectin domain-containing protein n=1 Tax=Panagrolaimus sp. ES5 TaxID=591445 RepID=A0AC34G6W6_9BILA